ncbi:MAG: DUF58 domain-containing protein [Sedimentisphaerales bacterium]|nr:DUF58 domain-containing protein [Sedimentisphaerales bacterium]
MAAVLGTSQRKLSDLLDPGFMARLDALDVLSHRMLKGRLQGERRSKRRGQSVEFADHRPYVVGDDLRFVDWNIYGRLDQLFLKLFLEEQDLTVHLLVDASASITQPDKDKNTYIRKLTAALGYVSLVGNNRVTITLFGDGIVGQVANMRGRAYIPRMAELILNTPCEGTSDFDKACRQAASSRVGTGVIIVVSDFLFKEGYESGLRRLIGEQYEVYAIQTLCPQELDPELAGDLKLVDVEDADDSEITVSSALLKYYKRNVTAYCNALKDFCLRRGGTYVLANTSTSVELMVLNYLRRIQLLR